MEDGQVSLSSIFGNRRVHFCHNPTAMTDETDTFGYIGDLTQCTTQKLGKNSAEVHELVQHLRIAVTMVGPKGIVVHIAHSQGALITSLAVKQLTKDEMKQMEVICFGGAEVIRSTPDFPFARCINYYSVNDPLLFVVPSAAKALRSGFGGLGYGSFGGKGQGVASTLAAMADPYAEPEFVFLTPRHGDPVKDHGLFGETYLDALRWEGRRYQTLYLAPWNNVAYILTTFGSSMGLAVHETIRKVVVFIMIAHAWIMTNIMKPIAKILVLIWNALLEIVRLLRGHEKYQPVVSASPSALSTGTSGSGITSVIANANANASKNRISISMETRSKTSNGAVTGSGVEHTNMTK